jgi:hypothetical protein
LPVYGVRKLNDVLANVNGVSVWNRIGGDGASQPATVEERLRRMVVGKLVESDYSQAELRVWAHKTQDPFLLSVYINGRDLHGETARRVFGESYTDEDRSVCKNGNFAIAYGSSVMSFLSQHRLPIDKMTAVAQEYERLMAVAFAWQERYVKEALRVGWAGTVFGRKRRVGYVAPEMLWSITNELKNFPIQSEGADLNLLTACVMIEEGYRVVLSMHDATYVECTKEEAVGVKRRLGEVMRALGEQYMPSVPWVVDGHIKQRWYKLPSVDAIELVSDEEWDAAHPAKAPRAKGKGKRKPPRQTSMIASGDDGATLDLSTGTFIDYTVDSDTEVYWCPTDKHIVFEPYVLRFMEAEAKLCSTCMGEIELVSAGNGRKRHGRKRNDRVTTE